MLTSVLSRAVPVAWDATEDRFAWIDAEGLQWSLPFFADTVREAMAGGDRPSFATVSEALDECEGKLPELLVFSMGRAGSTALTRLLERPGRLECLREPTPINDLLRAGRVGPERIAACARALSHACPNRRIAIKLSSWNLLFADRLLEAMPGVPIALLRRRTDEIVASYEREPASWLAPVAPAQRLHASRDVVRLLANAAERLAARADWIIEHDQVAEVAVSIAQGLGLSHTPAATAELVRSTHARHPERAFRCGRA